MDKNAYICIGIGILLVLILGIATSKKEGFTTAKRDGLVCPPLMNNAEEWLMPNSVGFVILGYNYEKTPRFFRDGQLITPLQYAQDYSELAYYFVVSAPRGLSGSDWILETSDFVEPLVFDGRTNNRLTVKLVRRRAGFHRWSVSK